MRYKLRLSKSIRNNFISLPQTSSLRTASLSANKAYLYETANTTPLKLQSLSSQSIFYFGFTGGTSDEPNTVEISEAAGLYMGLRDGEYVEVAIEYSFEKLKQIDMEPYTAEDFELVEKHSEFVEEQLLN